MLRVPTSFANVQSWARQIAEAINALIGRAENPASSPVDGDVRWLSGALKRYDAGTGTWINI